MNIILLSGGSGKRLWPLSNDIRSKQFIKIFKNEEDIYESMLQRMYKHIKELDENANIVIATSRNQVSNIKNQLGTDVDVSIEPSRKDTFPAIVLATSYLHDIKHISEDEVVVVCPIDPYVTDSYYDSLEKLHQLKEAADSNLMLMGIKPTYPSAKYGYIIPETESLISKVKIFKEKPDEETAAEYIRNGALWNSGVFAYKIKYLLDIAHRLIDFDDYNDLYNKYETLEKISFDYAVVEAEKNIEVIKYDGEWKDLGTWNTLTESINEKIYGKGIIDNTSKNSNIINELNIPIIGMGLEDMVIAASPDGILVTKKDLSSKIKDYVTQVEEEVMYAEKSWGTYKIINVEEESHTILVVLNPEHSMKYHSHEYRDEIWNVISGTGRVILDGIETPIKQGDIIEIKRGTKHTVVADSQLKIIEVQIGKEINVLDKQVYELGAKKLNKHLN